MAEMEKLFLIKLRPLLKGSFFTLSEAACDLFTLSALFTVKFWSKSSSVSTADAKNSKCSIFNQNKEIQLQKYKNLFQKMGAQIMAPKFDAT